LMCPTGEEFGGDDDVLVRSVEQLDGFT
jgi:hypothetical protein